MMEGLIYVAMAAVVIGVNQMLVWSAYHRGLADGYKKAADMLDDARKVAGL
jgi:hypothetical protein